MDRRRFLTAAARTFGAFGIPIGSRSSFACKTGAQAESDGSRPNLLILMSDQHKRTCMGAAGDKLAITPNLDGLARQSVRFTNAYCTNPLCAPSRAPILTGLHSHNLESRGNAEPFSPKHKTLADHFSHAGYFTGLIGKMHMVDAQTHGFNYKLEFNDWLQYLGPKVKLYADELGRANSGAGLPEIDDLWLEEGDPWDGHRTPDGRKGAVAVGRPSLLEERDHFDNFVARESVRFLENYAVANEPFLLIASFLKPHDPFMPAKRFAGMFQAEQMRLPDTWGHVDLDRLPQPVRNSIEKCGWTPELLDASEARKRMAYYYANLAQMDDCAGKVLRALERLRLDRNTIIIYTSDHGEMLGDLGLWNKFQFYEGSCGVPLTIRLPDSTAAQCDKPVSLVSLVSTVAELCNVPLLTANDGQSFADLVVHPAGDSAQGPVFAEYDLGRATAKYMIREGDFKYTFWVHDIDELYDLRSDPQERCNLAADVAYQEQTARLKQQLFAWHRPAEM